MSEKHQRMKRRIETMHLKEIALLDKIIQQNDEIRYLTRFAEQLKSELEMLKATKQQ